MPSATYGATARRREEQGMTDTCVIVERITARDPDPQTGKRATSDRPVYAGPCEYVAGNTQVHPVESGGRALFEQGAVLKLPVGEPSSSAVHEGHIATVTLDSQDPAAPVVTVRISGNHSQTFAVSRRFPVEVTTTSG